MQRAVIACALACAAMACADDDAGLAADGGDVGNVEAAENRGGHDGLPKDEDESCNLKTDFEGDDFCILPPEKGKGIQVHVGPKNYDDPKEVEPFLLMPGQEVTECYFVKSSNTKVETYFPRKFRMRPGSHHLITNFIADDVPEGWGDCEIGDRRGSFGGAEKAAVDYPTPGSSAPENEGFGRAMPPGEQLKIELHHINTTDKPILREAWINIYWKPKSEITTWVQDMFVLGGLSVAVPPGARQIYNNQCVMQNEARIVDIYGHFHAHTTRFSAWITRDGKRQLFYEVYDWHDTPTFAYDTVTENPEPDPEALIPGGSTGTLELKDGDILEWECEVDNTTDVTLRYRNELETGEMCNLFGTYVGDGTTLTTCRDLGEVTDL